MQRRGLSSANSSTMPSRTVVMLTVVGAAGLQLGQRCAQPLASRGGLALTMMAGARYIDSMGQEIKPALSACIPIWGSNCRRVVVCLI